MSFNQGLFSESIISITKQEEPLITQFTSTFINKMDVLTKVVMEKGMGLSENSVDKCTGECVSICCI